MNKDELRFVGRLEQIAENLGFSFSGMSLQKKLFSEYSTLSDGVSESKWSEKRLKELFKALGEYPKWIDAPDWPFESGKPMEFVAQFSDMTPGREVEIYVFRSKVECDGGWKMIYKCIEQDFTLARINKRYQK